MHQRSISPKLSKNTSKKKYFQPEGERRSPTPSQTARLYKMKQIQSYSKTNRPQFTMAKHDMISKKLESETEAMGRVTQRLRKEQLFVKYKRNPMMSFSQTNLNRSTISRKTSQPKVHKSYHYAFNQDDEPCETIVEALNDLKDKRIKRNEQPLRYRHEKQDLSLRISLSVSGLQPRQRKIQREVPSVQVQVELSFDQIICMKDDNFFIEHRKNSQNYNLFSYMKRSFSSLMSADILEKHHFAHLSIIEKNQKYRTLVFRDLSKLSRLLAAGKFKGPLSQRLETMKPTEVQVDIQRLAGEDLISIASGRFTTQKVFKVINDQAYRKNTFNSESSSFEQQEIIYNENTNQNMMNFAIQEEEEVEIKDYQGLQYNRSEIEFAKKCNYFHRNMVKHLDIRSQLSKNTIKDAQQHKKFRELVAREQEAFLNFHGQTKAKHPNKQTMIEMNKIYKDRKQAILLRQLVESVLVKNRTETQIDKLLVKQSKIKKRMI